VIVRRISKLRLPAIVVSLSAAWALAGCETGNYPLDIFPEMHYQASHRTQEGPQIDAPSDSIPTTGKEAPVTDFVATLNTKNPVPFDSDSLEAGRALFVTNCSMCHGLSADGETFVAQKFEQYGEKPPPSLRRKEVVSQQDGALFWTLSNGVNRMPSFKRLLTAEERWTLVNYVRSLPS
jgi:cytochrome c1